MYAAKFVLSNKQKKSKKYHYETEAGNNFEIVN